MPHLATDRPTPASVLEDKVTGRARYAADLKLPGSLVAGVVRSPVAHARIVDVDTSAAEALPGVHAVLSGADLADRPLIGRIMHDMPILARDRVRFVGEKVVAVAAESSAALREALALVKVRYEELPAVLDHVEALDATAPVLHPERATYDGLPDDGSVDGNVQSRIVSVKGDVDAGFEESDAVFEHVFTTPTVHQLYIEPHSCLVDVGRDGTVRVWANTKSPFKIIDILARISGVEPSGVRVHCGPIGGDFGGKGSFMDVPLCYELASAAGMPVQLTMSYREELLAANPRHASTITVRTGVKHDGRLWARDLTVVFNGGAYAAFKPVGHVNLNGAFQGAGAYAIPNVRMTGICAYTNQVPCGHFRAPGEAQVIFAVESATDMIAEELGLDPYALRVLNALRPGQENGQGYVPDDVRIIEVLEAARDAAGPPPPRSGGRGRGIAVFNRKVAAGSVSAQVGLSREGLVLKLALPDTGTGLYAALAEVVARTMGVSPELVSLDTRSADGLPRDAGVGATRVTVVAGEAASAAASEVRAALLERVERRHGCEPGSATIAGGDVTIGAERIPFPDAVAQVLAADDSIVATHKASAEKGAKRATVATAQIADVSVDPETGEVTVERVVTAHDVGTVFNPIQHQGQIEGGFVQGLGYALREQLDIVDGAVTARSMADCRPSTIRDVPDLRTVLVEGGAGPGPFSAKPIGESALSGVAPAIANAVADAVGVRVTSLPITPDKILSALPGAAAARPVRDQ